MDAFLRAAVVYVVVLLLLRMRGKRQLNQLEAFDLVLLLIISEAVQQSLLGNDFSLVNGMTVVASLIAVDLLFELGKRRLPWFERVVTGTPTLLMHDGRLLDDRLRQEGIEVDDILEAARTSQGIASLDDISHVVLERNGSLSVIPRSSS